MRYTVLICESTERPGETPGVVVIPQASRRTNFYIKMHIADTRLAEHDVIALGMLHFTLSGGTAAGVRAALDLDEAALNEVVAPLFIERGVPLLVPLEYAENPEEVLEVARAKAISKVLLQRALYLQAQR